MVIFHVFQSSKFKRSRSVYQTQQPNLPLLSFGWPTIAVDTHIFRVSNRTKFAMGKDVVAVEQKLEKVVPKEFKVDVHHWLILHGRYVCTARKPKCGSCIIEDLCEFKEKTE